MGATVERDIVWAPLRAMLRPLLFWYNSGDIPLDSQEFEAWDDAKVSIFSAKRLGNSDPTYEKLSDDGAGSVGVYASTFSHLQNQEVFFDLQLPHQYKRGTDIKFHIHWAPTTNAAGSVIWGLEYTVLNRLQPIAPSGIVEVAVAAPGSVVQLSSDIQVITGVNLVESSLVVCRFFRQTTGNTYAAKAFALSADFHIRKNKPGTYTERLSA